MKASLGPLLQSFFTDHLAMQKGLRIGSIRSYRDTIRLFLSFVAKHKQRSIATLCLDDLTFDRTLSFLKHLERDRGNSVRTRNQRRAALNTFFAYIALRAPEMLATLSTSRRDPRETHSAADHTLP